MLIIALWLRKGRSTSLNGFEKVHIVFRNTIMLCLLVSQTNVSTTTAKFACTWILHCDIWLFISDTPNFINFSANVVACCGSDGISVFSNSKSYMDRTNTTPYSGHVDKQDTFPLVVHMIQLIRTHFFAPGMGTLERFSQVLTTLVPRWGFLSITRPNSAASSTWKPRTAPSLLPRSRNFFIASRALRCNTLPGRRSEYAAFPWAHASASDNCSLPVFRAGLYVHVISA